MQYTTLALAALLGAAAIVSAEQQQQQISAGAGHLRRPAAVGRKNNPTSLAVGHQLSRVLQDPVAADVEDDHAHEDEEDGDHREDEDEGHVEGETDDVEHHDDEHGEEEEDGGDHSDLDEPAVVAGDDDEEENEDEHAHGDEHEEVHGDEDEEEHHDEQENKDDHGHEDHDEEDEFSASTMNANANSEKKPWKEVILATLLVNVAALCGVIFLIPTVFRSQICGRKKSREAAAAAARASNASHSNKLIDLGIPSFAAGALLAASVFLIIPEAFLLVRSGTVSMINGAGDEHDDHDDHDDEDMHADEYEDDHDHAHRFLQDNIHDDHAGHEGEVKGVEWKFGCAILGGYLIPMVLGAMFPRAQEHECDDECGEAPGLRDENAAGKLALLDTAHGIDKNSVGSETDDHCCHCEVEAATGQHKDAPQDAETATLDATQTIRSGESSDGCEKGKDCEDPDDCLALDHDHDHHNHGSNDGHHRESVFKDEAHILESGEAAAASAHGYSHAHAYAQCAHSAGVPTTKTRNYRSTINYPLCATILLGDSFHNFADGIFVGIGFLLCSRDVALSILFITLYHEIAQELADFFILTKHAGLSVPWALALNFLSGLSVMLGGITVLAVQDLTAQAVGLILAVAAGVYIYIGATECIPRVDKQLHGWKDRALGIVMFAVGAIPIGLALLNHQHCDGSH